LSWHAKRNSVHGEIARVSRRNAKGFPLLLIQVGGAEALFDDTTRMISLLKEAGVAVKVAVWKDKAHVWHFFTHMLDKVEETLSEVGC